MTGKSSTRGEGVLAKVAEFSKAVSTRLETLLAVMFEVESRLQAIREAEAEAEADAAKRRRKG